MLYSKKRNQDTFSKKKGIGNMGIKILFIMTFVFIIACICEPEKDSNWYGGVYHSPPDE